MSARLSASALACLVAALGCSDGSAVRFPIEPPDRFQTDILSVERVALEAQRTLGAALFGGMTGEGARAFESAFAPGFRARFPHAEACGLVEDDGVVIRTLPATDEERDVRGFLAALRSHTNGWSDFERMELEADRFWLSPAGDRATARMELFVSAREDGARVELRASFHAQLAREPKEPFRFVALSLDDGMRLRALGASFVDVTDEVGLRYNVSASNRAMLQTFIDRHQTLALGGLSAVDWNHDGFWDLLGTRKGQLSTLFLNDGAGGFVPAPLPLDSPRERPSFLLYADLDGDGLEELVGTKVLSYSGSRARLGLYTRRGGEWVLVEDALEFENAIGLRLIAAQSAVPFDANGDGLLDIFVAVYGTAHSRGAEFNTVEAHDGGDNHLFINLGGLQFAEASAARGIHGEQFTYVAQAFDFDADGDQDLFEGNDFGPNILWENDGTGHFRANETLGFGGVSAYTMGVTLADWDNSGVWSLYISNMSSEAGARIVPLATGISETMRGRIATIADGNMLYRQPASGVGPWVEHAREAHCDEAEWAWGCVFFDLDNDADKDLFVTNGFTSHSNDTLGDWEGHYWNQVAADGGFLERGERSRDVNRLYRFEGSFSGYERDRFFYNADGGGQRFFEAASAFGLDFDHDGRCAIPVDVDGDGDLDLALWTLQGLRMLENRAEGSSFVRLALRATSTSHALGAIVSLDAGGVTQREHVRIVDGFQSQVPRDLHFGLADATSIESVEVVWPSGETQTWSSLAAGVRYELVEGEAEAVGTPLPSWPAATRPRGTSPRLEGVDGPAVVRIADRGAWPDREAAVAPLRDARCILVTPSQQEAAAGLEVVEANETFLNSVFGDEEPSYPTTLVYDSSGDLCRVFRRDASAADVAAVLATVADEDDFPELLILAGRLELDDGRFDRARALFERAVTLAPENARALEGLARSHVGRQRFEAAEAAYARAVSADPDYVIGQYNLGIVRTKLGRPSEAIEPLRAALRIAGENEEFLRELAKAALLAEELEVALDAYQRARALAPESAELALLEAKVLGKLRRYAEARAAFQRVLALDPASPEARAGLELVERLLAREAGD